MSYESIILSEAEHGGLPVAYWPLDESNGTVANDLMIRAKGAGNNGTYVNTPTLDVRPGPINRENGTPFIQDSGSPFYLSKIVQVDGSSIDLDGSNITIEAWVKYQTGGGYARIVDRVYNGQFAFYIYTPTATLSCAATVEAGGTFDYGATGFSSLVVPINQWSHVAVSWNGTEAVGHLNGVSQSRTPPSHSGGLAASTANIRIGQRVDAGETRIFVGQIGHVVIYDYVLSADRIKAHYLAGLNGTPDKKRLLEN